MGNLAALVLHSDGSVEIAIGMAEDLEGPTSVAEARLLADVAEAAQSIGAAWWDRVFGPAVVEDAERMADEVDPPNDQPGQESELGLPAPVETAPAPVPIDPPSGGEAHPEPVAAVESVIPPAPAPTSDVTFTCDRCPRSFGSAHALRIHVARGHREEQAAPSTAIPAPTLIRAKDALPFQCFGCDRGFATGTELAEHRRSYEHRQRVSPGGGLGE